MKRTRVINIAAGAIVLLAAGVAWWSMSRPTPAERLYEPTPDEVEIAQDAQAAYATLDMSPSTALISAPLTETELARAEAKLRTLMAQFMFNRISTTDGLAGRDR